MQKKQGFTLIELLVVIAIIGILSAIGLTALSGAQSKARDVKRKADLGALNASIQLFVDSASSTGTGLYPYQATATDLMVAATTEPIKVASAATTGGFAIPKAPTPYGTDEMGSYWYVSDGSSAATVTMFALFTKLENTATGAGLTGTWFISNSKGYSDTVNSTAALVDPATGTSCGGAADSYMPCLAAPTM